MNQELANAIKIYSFITVTLAGYEHKEGKMSYNGFRQHAFIPEKTMMFTLPAYP